jgi:hypothetical protein
VSPLNCQRNAVGGSTIHADWWGGWNPSINKQFIDNCVNDKGVGVDHGCGFGYLTDGGPDGLKPYPGPAMKYRKQYTGPIKVPASTLFRELCNPNEALSSPQRAALCKPNEMRIAAAMKGSVGTAKDGASVTAPSAPPAMKLIAARSGCLRRPGRGLDLDIKRNKSQRLNSLHARAFQADRGRLSYIQTQCLCASPARPQ